MDKQYIKENNIIEKYLMNQLTDEERQAFRVVLLFDEDLRTEVENTRALYKSIRQLTPQKPKTNRKKWLLLGILAAFSSILFFLYLYFTQPSSNLPKTPTIIQETPPPKDSTLEQKKEKIIPEPSKDTTPKKNTRPTVNQPIAAADLTPHPYLEQFVESYSRNDEMTFNISNPTKNQKLNRKNNQVTFTLKGSIITKEKFNSNRFLVRIFSNKKKDFDNFKPIVTAALPLEQKTNKYLFEYSSELTVQSGLYYFIIEDLEKEDMAYVGKFLVN